MASISRRGVVPGSPRMKNSGRKPGTPNHKTVELQERLAAMGCDPIEGMARIALGDTPCLECRGLDRKPTGKQKYSIGIAGPYVDVDHGTERTCQMCRGTKCEPIPAKLAGEMFRELAQYVAPKRKAIEHSGSVGEPMKLEVVLNG